MRNKVNVVIAMMFAVIISATIVTDNQLKQCIEQQVYNQDRYPDGFPILSMGSPHD